MMNKNKYKRCSYVKHQSLLFAHVILARRIKINTIINSVGSERPSRLILSMHFMQRHSGSCSNPVIFLFKWNELSPPIFRISLKSPFCYVTL